MAKIFTPTNLVRLTNVSVVRLKKMGKRFEIACYKNKVVEWRSGVEKDIDNVLQTHNIFSNVSKGQLANANDITKAFGNLDDLAICNEILTKGELQVSDRERQLAFENILKEIAHFVAENCVNPETKRPYPVTWIEKVMLELHFSAHPTKPVKVQAKELIKLMQTKIPIERAQMQIRVCISTHQAAHLKEKVMPCFSEVDADTNEAGQWILIGQVDPSQYKFITELIQREAHGKGQVELIGMSKITDSGEKSI